MTDFYDLTSAGADPVSLADMKLYLKKSSDTTDDTLITALITAAVWYGEKYTGREFRANTWKLLRDAFATRMTLNRSPVDTITAVKYLKAGSLVTVSNTVYYLKELTQCVEILLDTDQEWPTDEDEREQVIEIIFVTKAYARAAELINAAIKMHVAYMYYNRGDCTDAEAGLKSGADHSYNTFRISRV